jgi:hypothetical protein
MRGKGWMVALGLVALVSAGPVRGAVLPSNWQNKDVGVVNRPGSTEYDAATGKWTITGEGSDIWGADADNMQFAYTQLKGDGNITARILSQSGGHDDGWARNGVQIREDIDPDSRRLDFMLGNVPADPNANSRGMWYSYRRPNKAEEANVWNQPLGSFPQYAQEAHTGAVGTRELPVFVRLQRRGNHITAYLSPDGKVWSSQIVPQTLGDSPLPADMIVGLAVSGHNPDADTGTLSTMVADNVSVTNEVLAAGPSNVDATPSNTDNRVLLTWSGAPNATGYTVYRMSPGDTQFTMAGTVQNQNWFIDEGSQGFTNYRYVITATVDGKESAGSYPALASPGPIPSPAGSLISYDIGTAIQGSTKLENGVLTIQASGNDIWNNGDGQRFVASAVSGNFTITAKLLEKPTSANTDGWVKAGLMVRESLDPAARNAIVTATTNDTGDHAGTNFSWRTHYNNTGDESNATQDGLPASDVTFPLWLRLTRVRDHIEGSTSSDGTTYTKIGGDEAGVNLDRMSARVYVGYCVTNHRDVDLATAKFDHNSMKFE